MPGKGKSSGYVAKNAILLALALILGYLEAMLPAFFAVPGMKLGLPNIVILFALYSVGEKEAVTINLLRIALISLLFGNGAGFVYSLSGGLLSSLVMILMKRLTGFSVMTVSMAGGLSHNLGQLLAACFMLRSRAVLWYLPMLWIAGIVSGLAVGFICGIVTGRLNRINKL